MSSKPFNRTRLAGALLLALLLPLAAQSQDGDVPANDEMSEEAMPDDSVEAAQPLDESAGADDPAVLDAEIMPRASQSLLLDTVQTAAGYFTVGERGHILVSEDGREWKQVPVPTRSTLTSVTSADGVLWAGGHDGVIVHSTDGGQTWTRRRTQVWTPDYIDPLDGVPVMDVLMVDGMNGFAVGAYAMFLETTDGGANWEDVSDRLDNEDQHHLNAITEVKDSGLFAVGEMGGMYRSGDWGQTWETVEGPYEGSLFGALGTGETGGILVYGLRGHMFRSADFGKTWQQINLKGAAGRFDFGLSNGAVLKDGSVVVVGHGGSVLKSTDKGHNFAVINRADRLSLSGVSADEKGNLILVGQGGVHVASPTGTAPQQ